MILCAAVKFHIEKTDKDVVIPCRRHYEAFNIIRDIGFDPKEGYTVVEQGFIDTKSNFLTRKEAYHHACECGQLSNTVLVNIHNEILFSEDLY